MAKNIADWIREELADTEVNGRLVAIVLAQVVGTGFKELDNVIFGDKTWSPIELEKRFLGKCDNATGQIPGRHQFELRALFEGSSEPKSRKNFFVDSDTGDYRGLPGEPPTKEGLAQQAMRHMERVMELSIEDRECTSRLVREMLNTQAEELRNLRVEVNDAQKLVTEIGLKLIDKRGEHELKQLQYKRNSQLMTQWLSFMPALMNQLLGRDVFPQSTADTALIEQVANSLDEETIGYLATKVKPELWGLMANRFAAAIEKENLKKDNDQKLLREVNPEDNAAGSESITTTESEFEP